MALTTSVIIIILIFAIAFLIFLLLKSQKTIAHLQADKISTEKEIENNKTLEQKLNEKIEEVNQLNKDNATLKANNQAVQEKLQTQKDEITEIKKQFHTEFQNIANKILDEKSAKFTEANKTNMEQILKPLGENISNFKKQVQETYEKENKERFSLGERVKELAELNKTISQEAKSLTQALKGESKTQGRWGEMILESILEKSGLRKGEEYFIEKQLTDEQGKPLHSDYENKKMRADAVIKYPDERTVIIDSKVSLNAFIRYTETNDIEIQKQEIQSHVQAVKNHIDELSRKGYDDYHQTLDFVMMFIPSEAAYIEAIKHNPNLWTYAYEKRILLINPTNLIICLKLILDLWKREYQNENALAIAERGSKLYDKFVGFIKDLEKVGNNINNAQTSYDEAYKKLSTGNDNLVRQADKLKSLGIKSRKELPENLLK